MAEKTGDKEHVRQLSEPLRLPTKNNNHDIRPTISSFNEHHATAISSTSQVESCTHTSNTMTTDDATSSIMTNEFIPLMNATKSFSLDGMMIRRDQYNKYNSRHSTHTNNTTARAAVSHRIISANNDYNHGVLIDDILPRTVVAQDPIVPLRQSRRHLIPPSPNTYSSTKPCSPLSARRMSNEVDDIHFDGSYKPLLSSSKKKHNPDQNRYTYDSIHPSQNEINDVKGCNTVAAHEDIPSKNNIFFNVMYALVNTVMSVPCLYGYASVIFNHDAFQPYVSTLSKLVIWSSAVHQLIFVAFSSLPFAKAEVQDAGLVFLSSMSCYLANAILLDGGDIEEVISTTVVTFSIATASLGIVLILIGKFKYATIISFIPLPVVGGYLAFIGYFCFVAGIGLCISCSMVDGSFLSDMQILFNDKSIVLALPGFIAGLILTLTSRFASNDTTLPLIMMAILLSFYVVMAICGLTMEEAREGKWVGDVKEMSSIWGLKDLLNIHSIRWDLVFSTKILYTWLGMVFVVAFSSSLDVVAIAMDMGEVLDINKELSTVGLSNVASGLLLGQSGSYIFSQSIFQYRTGYHSRWIGFIGGICFLLVVGSSVDLLSILPLFFLGSTLIFIGLDLLYEWLWEVRHKLLLSEYCVLISTFIAIQIVGINGGILFGIIIAIADYVITTSTTSSLRRVSKRSKAIWHHQQRVLLHDIGYSEEDPKILCLEVKDTIFFGSSLQLLSSLCKEIGINTTQQDMIEIHLASPRHLGGSSPGNIRLKYKEREQSQLNNLKTNIKKHRQKPQYVVLDLSQVPNVDASAATGCFLQIANMCKKNGIILLASGCNLRVDWMLRSHDAAYSYEEEESVKKALMNGDDKEGNVQKGKIILFESVDEALAVCENKLLVALENQQSQSQSSSLLHNGKKCSLSTVFSHILHIEKEEVKSDLEVFDTLFQSTMYQSGERIFTSNTVSDSFFIVLSGCVGLFREEDQQRMPINIVSGAGSVRPQNCLEDHQGLISFLQVGRIFGYVDFGLDRKRSFSAGSFRDGTTVVQISRSDITRLKETNPCLHQVVEKVLLQASLMELASLDAL